jgi:hypothetical protein
MTTTFEAPAASDEPRFPLRLAFVAGRLVCSETVLPNWGQQVNFVDGRLSPYDQTDWGELSLPTDGDTTALTSGRELFAQLALLYDFDRPDMTDETTPTAPASSDDLLARIDDLLAESWTLNEGAAHMTPSQAPLGENWRL